MTSTATPSILGRSLCVLAVTLAFCALFGASAGTLAALAQG